MLTILQGALEQGILYAPVALALFLSYSILDIADLTTDGSFTLGCAVSAVVCLAGHPLLALPAAMAAGAAAGFVTAFLQTRLGVPSILAGIITNFGLYSVNLMVMAIPNPNANAVSNLPLIGSRTLFDLARDALGSPGKLLAAGLVVGVLCAALVLFLGTRLGLSIRATGDNRDMVRASSINPVFTVTVGLCIANAMTALSGAMVAQNFKSCDINIGTGMVVIGLASLIIGETLVGKRGMIRCVIAVLAGSIIYRLFYVAALRFNFPAEYIKLLSAVIVALAIAAPTLKRWFSLQGRKRTAAAARKGGGENA